eukprot:jgi/Bigna1/82606/fgenesh1_pg.94_\
MENTHVTHRGLWVFFGVKTSLVADASAGDEDEDEDEQSIDPMGGGDVCDFLWPSKSKDPTMDAIKRIFGTANYGEKDDGKSVDDKRLGADDERDVKMESRIDAKNSNKNDIESKGVNEDESDTNGKIRQRNKPLNREELLQKEIENARQIRETEQQVEQYKIREKEAEAEKPPKRYPFLGESLTSGEYITGLILMMKLVSSIYFGFHKREDVFCISRLTQRRVFFDRNPRDREGCTVVVSTSTPTSAPVINERLDGIKLQLKKSDTNVPKSSSIRAGLLEDGMDVECLSYDEFRDVCENSESCSPNVIRLLEDSFRIYASTQVLFLMAIPAIFGAIGTIYFRAFHPNDFFSRFSRSESFLMAFAKQNRKWLKCIFSKLPPHQRKDERMN